MSRRTGAFGAALKTIKAQQREWAIKAGHDLDERGYCRSLDDNFFRGLSALARRDFDQGDGDELGTDRRRGKIYAVHSSSALACNVFDYWRERDHEPLSQALGVSLLFESLQLEQKFATGLRPSTEHGKPSRRGDANLDVVLTGANGSIHAIESKFAEPYSPSATKTLLKPKYFAGGVQRWTDVRLPGCQAVAESLRQGQHDFHVLDVAQLLKHMLALAREGRRIGESWSLCCLWFEVPGAVADRHRLELDRFRALISVPTFSALTYQELFARLVPLLLGGHLKTGHRSTPENRPPRTGDRDRFRLRDSTSLQPFGWRIAPRWCSGDPLSAPERPARDPGRT